MSTSRRGPAVRVRLPRSLAGRLFAMQVLLVAAVVAGCAVFAYLTDRDQAEQAAMHRASATAKTVAASPSVRAAIRSRHPSTRLQPYAERVRGDTGVTFVTIMSPRGVRWSHPDPRRIGGRFLGHTAAAVRGGTVYETYTGTLGPSVRVVVPVRDDRGAAGPDGSGGTAERSGKGRVVGLVGAGIAVQTISQQLRHQVELLLGCAAGALALGGLGSYLLNARLRRHTHGMNAHELSRMHDYHQAALHAVREGLVMLDGQRRVALINDGARELLGLPQGPPDGPRGEGGTEAAPAGVLGRGVAELRLPRALTGALLASEPRVDEVHLTEDRVLVVNTSPVDGGERRGTVVTLRDHTELQSLTGELDSVRGFAEALRAQAHEAANRLHTVVSLIELGRTHAAVDFATEELRLAQALTDRVVTAVGEPVLAALLLGKAAQAGERGVELALTPDSRIDDGLLPPGLPPRDLVTVLGNLIDNAVDAAAAPDSATATEAEAAPDSATATEAATAGREPGRVEVTLRVEEAEVAGDSGRGGTPDGYGAGGALLLRVADNGPGIPAEEAQAVFERGWSTKPSRNTGGWAGDAAYGNGPGDATGGSTGTTRDPGAGTGGHARGLGLALVRQTVRRHGGTVTVSGAGHASTPDTGAETAGGGAEFTVRLPLPAAAPPEPPPPADRFASPSAVSSGSPPARTSGTEAAR